MNELKDAKKLENMWCKACNGHRLTNPKGLCIVCNAIEDNIAEREQQTL